MLKAITTQPSPFILQARRLGTEEWITCPDAPAMPTTFERAKHVLEIAEKAAAKSSGSSWEGASFRLAFVMPEEVPQSSEWQWSILPGIHPILSWGTVERGLGWTTELTIWAHMGEADALANGPDCPLDEPGYNDEFPEWMEIEITTAEVADLYRLPEA